MLEFTNKTIIKIAFKRKVGKSETFLEIEPFLCKQ